MIATSGAALHQPPPHVVERHDRSYTARKFIGEAVREIDDQRDVLYAFSWYAIRKGRTRSSLGRAGDRCVSCDTTHGHCRVDLEYGVDKR